jgi:hypothetical protein
MTEPVTASTVIDTKPPTNTEFRLANTRFSRNGSST